MTVVHGGESFRRTRTSVAPRAQLSIERKTVVAATAGLAGGIGLAVPVVVYDWATGSHSALELPMAATSWLFGLTHFAQNGYLWRSIVVGIVVLALYAVVSGAVFGAVADRILGLETIGEQAGAGIAWGFVSWLFSWYTLLPIARGGAPFHATAASTLAVAPIWVFVTGFAVLGLATALAYRVLTTEK